jgi:hypothetical protein
MAAFFAFAGVGLIFVALTARSHLVAIHRPSPPPLLYDVCGVVAVFGLLCLVLSAFLIR